MPRQRGFTLLELLVALGVLALLATIGWRGLDSILGAQVAVQAEMRRWSDVDRVMQQLGRDVSLAIEAPTAQGDELVIVRLGEADAGPAQNGPRRVGYRLRAASLEYAVNLPSAGAQAGKVLENVAAFELRVLQADGTWKPLLGGSDASRTTARALAAEITLASGERVSRIFPLP